VPGRETYTAGIVCKGCNNVGVATFSEVANPIFNRGHIDRITKWVSDGFALASQGPFHIACGRCGSTAVEQTRQWSERCLIVQSKIGCAECDSRHHCPEFPNAV